MRIVIIQRESKDKQTHTYLIEDAETIDIIDRLVCKFAEKQTRRTD